MKRIAVILAVVVSVALGGCMATVPQNQQKSAQTYERVDNLGAGYAREATVVAVRQVQVAASSNSGRTGTTVGAALGGLAGAAATKRSDGYTRAAATIVGGVLGSAIGNAVSRDEPQVGHEIIARTPNGQLVTVVQTEGVAPLIGQRVYLVGMGRNTRVVPAQ